MASKILKAQAQTFIDTFKLLIDENDRLKAQKEPSNGLKTFVEKSPLVKEVKALREDIQLKAIVIKELQQENQGVERENEVLEDKYQNIRSEHNELKRDYRELELEHEAHELEYAENIKELEEDNETGKELIEVLNHDVVTYRQEIRRLKEALNKVRRDLSPDR